MPNCLKWCNFVMFFVAGETGKYYCSGAEVRSSAESYDRDLRDAVWKNSCRLVKCQSGGGGDDVDDISLGS